MAMLIFKDKATKKKSDRTIMSRDISFDPRIERFHSPTKQSLKVGAKLT